MKQPLTFTLLILVVLVFTSCEGPTAPLAGETALATQSLAVEGEAANKGGNAGFSTELNQLLAEVRAATAQYHRIDVATSQDPPYVLPEDECASNPFGPGAMGVHYVNFALIGDAEFDPLQPEVLIYEPQKNGRMRLVAAEFVIFKDAWVAAGNDPEVAPTILGEVEFDKSFGPAAHGLPDHYEIHLWVWRNNPNGMFAPWNPKVTCDFH